jgi:hydroxymethylglutaryl-CoA synthase
VSKRHPGIGISGLAAYLPPYRVNLESWCQWNGDSWDKVGSVVGSSFRMPGPNENAYTMAATAVMRLIDNYDIDPGRVGYLALGTESSTDNSAGTVIIKGMINEALQAQGRPVISRYCEVPEFKHACLGGVYAMKSAARFLALDGAGRIAIVVCSDIAEYARGTSGEPTQGAGAVAMLIESDPKLLTIELGTSGSSSDYRGPDFRKPFSRFLEQASNPTQRPRDFPLFNGKYSTTCYIDEVLSATAHLVSRLEGSGRKFLREMLAVFLHRPYQRMAETGLAMILLHFLAVGDADDRAELGRIAALSGVDAAELQVELVKQPYVYDLVKNGQVAEELYPFATQALKAMRNMPVWQDEISSKLRLGATEMKHVGNLYTASLPAWIAAGLEEAAAQKMKIHDASILTVGYGSGDAAEIIPMQLVRGWESAASRIRFAEALADNPVDLTQDDYQSLHDSGALAAGARQDPGVFVIARTGDGKATFDDTGLEYYSYGALAS